MPEITLAQVLQAREDRVRKQQELLQLYHCPIISFTMKSTNETRTYKVNCTTGEIIEEIQAAPWEE